MGGRFHATHLHFRFQGHDSYRWTTFRLKWRHLPILSKIRKTRTRDPEVPSERKLMQANSSAVNQHEQSEFRGI